MQLPRLLLYDDTPIYNTRAAVRLTKVEAPRLRAWERRYAILNPQRSLNSYRLYSERDLAIIRWLRDQVEAGMTISQATVYLRNTHDVRGDAPPATLDADLPLPMTELVQTLVEAAQRLDEPMAMQVLRHALAIASVEDACQALITPALFTMGQRWAANHEQIVPEHFLSQVIRTQLDALWHTTHAPTTGPIVLVACAPGELHELGAFLLALFLRRQGMHVAFLGANTEANALIATAMQIKPASICLSSTLPEHKQRTIELAQKLAETIATHVFIGGQGMAEQNGTPIAANVTVLHTSGVEAAKIIQRAVNG